MVTSMSIEGITKDLKIPCIVFPFQSSTWQQEDLIQQTLLGVS